MIHYFLIDLIRRSHHFVAMGDFSSGFRHMLPTNDVNTNNIWVQPINTWNLVSWLSGKSL